MKIKLLVSILKDGKRHNEGDIINLDEHTAKNWINKKWGEPLIKKEAKPKKQTKELKIDSKETKDATNKD